jgi:hypothetical protein
MLIEPLHVGPGPRQSSGGLAPLPPMQTEYTHRGARGRSASRRLSYSHCAPKSYTYRNRSPRWRPKSRSWTRQVSAPLLP